MNSGPRLSRDGGTSGSCGIKLSGECLQQRCQGSAGTQKLILIALSQDQKQAPILWDMVASVPLGWGWRALLRYPNLGMVLHCGHILHLHALYGDLHLAKAGCTGDIFHISELCIIYNLLFWWRESRIQFWDIYPGFSLWCITNLYMVLVPPDLSQWLEACCTRHPVSGECYYLSIVSIFKSDNL